MTAFSLVMLGKLFFPVVFGSFFFFFFFFFFFAVVASLRLNPSSSLSF